MISKSLLETEAVAAKTARALARLSPSTTATVIGLTGDLGTGKTSFTKALLRELGVKEQVTSPTFIIFRRYSLADLPFKNVFHFDFYRLEEEKELIPLGWQEIVSNSENLLLVEWPEKIASALPSVVPTIRFVHCGADTRSIVFKNFSYEI